MTGFRILSGMEVGSLITAAQFVSRMGKPLAEGCCHHLKDGETVEELEEDIRRCLDLIDEDVEVFLYENEPRAWAVACYTQPWVLDAFHCVYEDGGIADSDRHWLAGLLFGYHPSEIQRFTDARSLGPEPTSRQCGNGCTEGTFRLVIRRSDTRSSEPTKCRNEDMIDRWSRSSDAPLATSRLKEPAAAR